jgi:putative mRNA 3-end processing factor
MEYNRASGLLGKARVARNGAILLARRVVCDAHAKRPVRVVTHAHWDHIGGLERSIASSEAILMTPATRDILEVLRSKRLLSSPKVQTLDYGEAFSYGGETVTFYQAGHIPGSAHVVVQAADGTRVTYTGDFKLPRASPQRTDILVMEATYGNPAHVRKFEQDVEAELVSLIGRSAETSPVFILGYHGKLQEVLELLGKARLSVPVILQERIYMVTRALEAHGFHFGQYGLATRDKLGGKGPFVALFHMRARKELPEKAVKVILSGWEFERPIKATGPGTYVVALSDHSDFEGLMGYVEKSKPKFVITDGYRVGDAKSLAAQIGARLGIPAQAMP